MRLFFALWPDDDTRARIATVAAALPVEGRVVPQNYHLTLAFIGEIAIPQVAFLQHLGRTRRARSFTITIDEYQHWEGPQVLVAAARQIPDALALLWAELHEALEERHADLNRRGPCAPRPASLRAHVTLARKVVQAPVAQAMSAFDWNARSFSLVRSDTSGQQSAYTVLDTWPLLDELPKP